MDKPSLLGLDEAALLACLRQNLNDPKLPAYRAGQIYSWLYQKGAAAFSSMSSIAKPMQDKLAGLFSLDRPTIQQDHLAKDGTRKWLISFDDGAAAEMVYIPEEKRGTLCVSSQVGCSLTCSFCHTGTQKLVRNLTAGEIVGQVMLARDCLDDWHSGPGVKRKITNIVFMGMGEPLYNPDNVAKAVNLMVADHGLAFSKRRVTLSTSGIAPEIPRFGQRTDAALAISLHAVTDQLRDQLVPINRKYKLAELMDAIRAYPGLDNARRVTFEYIMLDGVNDSLDDAKKLAQLIRGIPSKVNLIPFNPWPGSDFRASPPDRLEAFAAQIRKAGYTATVRKTRGDDVLAACGQLKSASQRLSKQEREALEALRQAKESMLALPPADAVNRG